MARAATKRRQTPSKRAPKNKKGATKDKKSIWLPASGSHWLAEVFSVVSGAICIFLVGSVLSHKLSSGGYYLDPATTLSDAARNIMGPMGHLLGTILTGFMGWCALVPAAWAGGSSLFFWHVAETKDEKGEPIDSLGLFVLGMVLSLVFCCALASLFFGERGGGMLGTAVANPAERYCGLTGAGLFFSAGLLLSIALATQRRTWDLVFEGVRGLYVLLKFSLVKVPMAVTFVAWNVIRTVTAGIAIIVARFVSFFSARRSVVRIDEEKALPKPRVRKNKVVKEATPASHEIVVKRREQWTLDEPSRRGSKKKDKKRTDKVRKVLRSKRDIIDFEGYELPSVDLLARGEASSGGEDDELLREKSRLIEDKLRDFKIDGRITQVHPGPVITLFEFEPAPGVKVGRIASLQDDLAMSLRASSIRIIAPIPRKGTVGIEVPNKERDIVRLRDVLESEELATSNSLLTVPLGKNTSGDPVTCDVATMPHLLMAGATGTGKSVCINAMLLSLLYRATPAELGLILIDPKILELSVYEDIPHLRVPVVTVPRQAKACLEWAVKEMNRRYRLLHKHGVRSVDGYNQLVRGEELCEPAKPIVGDDLVRLDEGKVIEAGEPIPEPDDDDGLDLDEPANFAEPMKPLPKIVIVIDELADLMLSVGREIEDLIARLAQKARAAGIHLIVATQRPSVDVITGLIKANFPARVSFRVSSRVDSRTILDSMGAEKLLGRGDMLFIPPGGLHAQRVHGAFVSDTEVKKVVESIKGKARPCYDDEIMQACEKALEEDDSGGRGGEDGDIEYDAFYDRAVELVVEKGQASTSMIQRAFRIGYNRAARIIDTMESEGVVGPMDGVKPREVLVGSIE